MPLRVSWSFDQSDANSVTKSRLKMYREGHYARLKRPSGPELYEDASRILDELLQKQLNDQLKARGRPPRYKTHPFMPISTSGEVLDERDELALEGFEDQDGIERCKTMPSRMRGNTKDGHLLTKDLGASKNKTERLGDMSGDSSSADTEGDSSLASENRKKKGFLRRAKDRLIHSFHRQEREREKSLKDNDSPKVSPKKQPRKSPRKKGNLNGVKETEQNNGNGKDSVQSSQSEGYSKRRNSAGKVLLNTIRKSIRGKKDDQRNNTQDDASSDKVNIKRPSGESSSGTSKGFPTPAPSHSSHDACLYPGGSSLAVPTADRKGSSISRHEKSTSPYPHSSSTDSHLDNGDKSSSLYSFSSNVPFRNNVLDNPGDDIKYMDMAENGDSGWNGDGDMDRTLGYGRTGVIIKQGEEASEDRMRHPYKQQSSLCIDGDNDSQDGKGRVLCAEDELPLHERTEEEKGQMYEKIAQKLINIADNFAAESGMSDAEAHSREGAAAPAAEGDGVLSELERQILECLRDAGDRNTQIIDGQAEEMVQKAKAQTYERFKETVQHSLGNDVSWNHLAFLFYTTKGVMSAVGKGSQIASDAKEMTLRYFSDKFAKWLMDQGGFDSVLSESDSELD